MASSATGTALPRPGPIGRIVRLGLGGLVLWFAMGIALEFPALTDGMNARNPLGWLAIAYCLYLLPDVARLTLGLRWAPWPVRAAGAGLLASAASLDAWLTGDPNGLVFGVGVGVLLVSVLGVLGASLLLAAATAAPG
jgi:hypothetical protein